MHHPEMEPPAREASRAYDLGNLSAPRLVGWQLRAFLLVLRFPITRWLILPGLMRQSGFPQALRERGYPEPPTYSERHPPPQPPTKSGPQGGVQSAAEACMGVGGREETALDFHEAYLRGDTTPLDVAERFLAAAQDAAELNIFVELDPVDVRRQAAASADRYRAGMPLSPLDGVPVAVKDEFAMAGYPTGMGTSFYGTEAPTPGDCAPVARLRACGALLIGKAHMTEIGLTTFGHSATHGPCRNPNAPGHYPGGSSSGPAAAVAAGLCPLALGADGGGSIRIPSSFCGVAGLKPTGGRVPTEGTPVSLAYTVGVAGPLGRSVADCALGLAAISGGEEAGWPQADLRPAAVDTAVRSLRLGVDWRWFEDAAPEVVETCRSAVESLASDLGLEIRSIEIPELNLQRVAHAAIIGSEMAASVGTALRAGRPFAADTLVIQEAVKNLSASDFVAANKIRTRALAHWGAVFEEIDVVITPSTACTAPPIRPDEVPLGQSNLPLQSASMRYVFPANLTGLPAASVPVGRDGEGLPVGLQLCGRAGREDQLLQAARALEARAHRSGKHGSGEGGRADAVRYRLLPQG